jgi:hypothetical protein
VSLGHPSESTGPAPLARREGVKREEEDYDLHPVNSNTRNRTYKEDKDQGSRELREQNRNNSSGDISKAVIKRTPMSTAVTAGV